jgi:hypothetical protein
MCSRSLSLCARTSSGTGMRCSSVVSFRKLKLNCPDSGFYSWALSQLRKHAGAAAWGRVRSVGTDGEPSFPDVLASLLPEAFHYRCIWHIYENLTHRLSATLGSQFQAFMAEFSLVFYTRDQDNFATAWAALLLDFPLAERYLTSKIFPIRQQWALAWTQRHLTFGRTTTQLGESQNSVRSPPLCRCA